MNGNMGFKTVLLIKDWRLKRSQSDLQRPRWQATFWGLYYLIYRRESGVCQDRERQCSDLVATLGLDTL